MLFPLRTLLLLFLLACCLGIDPLPASAQPAPSAEGAEPLFYTVQVGSFGNQKDASVWYNRLAEQLPAPLRQHLRIEIIPPFHTVRIGKTASRQEIAPVLSEIEKFTKQASVIHGYFRKERILELYDDQAMPTPPAGPIATIAEPPASPNAKPAPPAEPEAKPAASPEGQGEPLDNSAPPKETVKAKPSRDSKPPSSSPPANSTEEPLYYTIQIGSFGSLEDALSWFNRLSDELPVPMKQELRIEEIPPFHTVRVGKAAERQDVITIFEETQKVIKKQPAIIHGYYRPDRIRKHYDPSAATGKPAASHLEPTQEQSRPATATTQAPTSTPTPTAGEEPLETPSGAKLAPLPTEKTRRQPSPQKAADKKPTTQIPNATLKQLIIDKYLSAQTADPKAREALIAHSQAIPESPGCVTTSCHAEIKSFSNTHQPAKTDRCTACHKQTNSNHPDPNTADFQLVAAGADLCNACHPKLQGRQYGHEPAAKGECLQCHTPHGANNQFLLRTESDNQQKLCQQCHDSTIAASTFAHGPVGLGACTFCHTPHESDHKGLLKSAPQALCFECHADISKGVQESTSVHQVVKTEGCSTCHLPHGSQFPHLLKQNIDGFCYSCHTDIEDSATKSRSKHAALDLEGKCSTCHQPHFSQYPKLLASKEFDLCLSCHSDKNTISAKSPKDIASELKMTFIHQPLAQGQCAACHDPHGSKFLKLLAGPYPDSIYEPYSTEIYDFCFTCHDKGLLTSQTTSSATAFRNGAKNLHYLHAAIPQKGRTCRTCHQAHSSNGPKLINQTGSAFGEWQMSISFSTTGGGGSCMPGCHRRMEYNRDKEVNNALKETDFGKYHVEYESVK